MFKLENLRFVPLLLSSILLMGAQASAQFEVSPDHVESPARKQVTVRRPAGNQRKTRAGSPTSQTRQTAAARTHKRTPRKQTGTASVSGQPQTTAALAPQIGHAYSKNETFFNQLHHLTDKEFGS